AQLLHLRRRVEAAAVRRRHEPGIRRQPRAWQANGPQRDHERVATQLYLTAQLVQLQLGIREEALRRRDLEDRASCHGRAGRVMQQGQAQIDVLQLNGVELLGLLRLWLRRLPPHRRDDRAVVEADALDREVHAAGRLLL